MGCGQCKLLRSLKFENYIEELIGVDINATALQTHQHYVQPLTTDYLIRRPRPLKVQLLKGLSTSNYMNYAIYIYIYIYIYIII